MKLRVKIKQQLQELEDNICDISIFCIECGLDEDKEMDFLLSKMIDSCTALHKLLNEIM